MLAGLLCSFPENVVCFKNGFVASRRGVELRKKNCLQNAMGDRHLRLWLEQMGTYLNQRHTWGRLVDFSRYLSQVLEGVTCKPISNILPGLSIYEAY